MSVRTSGLRVVAFTFAMILVAAASGQAQQPPAEVQELQVELQQIQQRLAAIETKALEQNEELRAKLEATTRAVLSAVTEVRPEAPQEMERLETLQQQVQEASQAGDEEKARSLVAEAMQIQAKLAEAQAEAVKREDVALQVESFQDDLLAGMRKVDSATDSMFSRIQEIARQIR